jgi:Type VI secretion system (T6SS), amidase effector protein 4
MPRKLPNFQTMWNNYPLDRDPCDDKASDGSNAWKNQCAIRISATLVSSGFALTNYADPKCSHGHARGAESLANYLWKQVGRPKIAKNATDARKIASQSGCPSVVFFRNLAGFRGGEGDHIDLYNCSLTKTGEYFESCQEVWIWLVCQ